MDIVVPSVGESVTEGILARWFKKDGDSVRADEPLYELETDKATSEVNAPTSGRLRIVVPEGQTVPVGSVVARIEEGRPAQTSGATDAAPDTTQSRSTPEAVPRPADARPAASTHKSSSATPTAPAASGAEPILMPAARPLVAREGIDPRSLKGTGRGGRVTKEDVLAHLQRGRAETPTAAATSPAAPAADGPSHSVPAVAAAARGGAAIHSPHVSGPRETRQRMSAIRQRIAERLVAAKNTAAILTTINEADLSAVLTLRGQYKDSFRERYGVSLGFMSFFVKACVEALRAFPVINARIDGNDIVYQHFYDIGVAVSTEKGLMVPVVRDADRLTFAQVETRIAALAQKARDGKIEVSDLQGGTFTITNGGVFGSLLSTPILNPPQSAILGMHAIQQRPVAVKDQVVIRPMMYLALSYDHRLIDGREAVQFLVRVKQCIESPERLLLEV